MDTKAAIRLNYNMAEMIYQAYLSDLTDAELLVRSVPGINHIAWQLGHLIDSEHGMIDGICPGVMPPLPAGFKEKHLKETSTSDNPADFLTKDEYLKLLADQRKGTLEALARQTDADFDKPAPESMQSYAPTVGDVFTMIGMHWVMHAGQWVVVRRALGFAPFN